VTPDRAVWGSFSNRCGGRGRRRLSRHRQRMFRLENSSDSAETPSMSAGRPLVAAAIVVTALTGCASTGAQRFPEGTYITDIATADVPLDAQPPSIRSFFPGHFKITFSDGHYTIESRGRRSGGDYEVNGDQITMTDRWGALRCRATQPGEIKETYETSTFSWRALGRTLRLRPTKSGNGLRYPHDCVGRTFLLTRQPWKRQGT
jgi:hypothetical protein